jgi:hypothetical protein
MAWIKALQPRREKMKVKGFMEKEVITVEINTPIMASEDLFFISLLQI